MQRVARVREGSKHTSCNHCALITFVEVCSQHDTAVSDHVQPCDRSWSRQARFGRQEPYRAISALKPVVLWEGRVDRGRTDFLAFLGTSHDKLGHTCRSLCPNVFQHPASNRIHRALKGLPLSCRQSPRRGRFKISHHSLLQLLASWSPGIKSKADGQALAWRGHSALSVQVFERFRG